MVYDDVDRATELGIRKEKLIYNKMLKHINEWNFIISEVL